METEKSYSSSKQRKKKSSLFTIEKSEDLRKEKVSISIILLVECYILILQYVNICDCFIDFHFVFSMQSLSNFFIKHLFLIQSFFFL